MPRDAGRTAAGEAALQSRRGDGHDSSNALTSSRGSILNAVKSDGYSEGWPGGDARRSIESAGNEVVEQG
jgi:hypothetical protein